MAFRATLGLAAIVVLLAVSQLASPVSADPPVTGYPNSIAATGDSITQADDSEMLGDSPANSWATGTRAEVNSIYSRLLAVYPPIAGHNYNNSVSGSRMTHLNGQAATTVSQGAELVTILLGANDVCTASEASMTSVATFESQFTTGIQTLTAGLPNARIAVSSIPDIFNLWSIMHENGGAQFIWSTFGICQSMLANPTSMAPADVTRRANVRQRNIDFNTVLHDVCAQYVHCRFDNNAGFNTAYTPADVSGIDFFHPSIQGQALAAQTGWNNSYDFTDSTAPVSNASSAIVVGGLNVTLTATDAAGVSGIEYKIGAGAYQKYTAPMMLTTGTQITWRAVDVNGNSERTHTCRVAGWAWIAGDGDCDGFSDSAETFAGTNTSTYCAATPAMNDESGADAWPVDFDDNQKAILTDVTRFGPVFNSVGPAAPYNIRFDFNSDGRITITDVTRFGPFFGKTCTP